MSEARQIVAGGLVTLAVVAGAALLSSSPVWRVLPPETGVVSVSFTHGGARNCRELSAEELERLPPNMRRTSVCDRGRAPLRFEVDIDGRQVFGAVLQPGGLAGDGPSEVYERFELPAGPHEVELRLADTGRETGFDHTASRRVELAAAQNLVIDFRPERGGFVFH